ncbi:MAG: LPS assembly protein LptD [Pseudomonadota bacterium]
MLRLLACLLVVLIPVRSLAQEEPPRRAVALLADRIFFDNRTRDLTASGNVQVFYEGSILQANSITYNDVTGEIRAPDGLTLQTEGNTVLFADAAELTTDLRDGLIEGARGRIAGSLQIASGAAIRREGRYNVLSKVVASTCVVCEAFPVPIWQIRADRVVHDEETKTVHYENAVFDAFGIPVLYLPYFQHPDPSVERASGILFPTFLQSDRYGYGVKQPVFIDLGPTKDATITPFVTSEEGTILEGEYRQRFDRASLDLRGSLSASDAIDDDELRWHLFTDARYHLPFGAVARLSLRNVSNDAYLRQFGFSNADRLTSTVAVEQFGDRGFWRAQGTYYTSLREDEPQGELPIVLPEVEARKMLALGDYGSAELRASSVVITRDVGRDVRRVSAGTGWEKSEIIGPGLVLRGFAAFDGDIYQAENDEDIKEVPVGRIRPIGGAEVRFPLARESETVTQIIEPIAQLVFAGNDNRNRLIPNEDSLQVEFDSTNLFSDTRFPGTDRFEPGSRLNVGLRYEALLRSGIAVTAGVGQVLRRDPVELFAPGTGLSDTQSNYVVTGDITWDDRFRVAGALLTDDSGNISRNEASLSYSGDKTKVSGTYIFLAEDDNPDGSNDRSELRLNGERDIGSGWIVSGGMRRNLSDDKFIETSGGLSWGNECARFIFSVSRDFTRSDTVEPSTEFSFTVRLDGLGGPASGRTRAVCLAPG